MMLGVSFLFCLYFRYEFCSACVSFLQYAKFCLVFAFKLGWNCCPDVKSRASFQKAVTQALVLVRTP